MNLAWKDVRFNRMRFALAGAGLAAILTMALGMNGLYRGIVHESLVMVDGKGADAWLVQGGRDGPFDDESRVGSLLDRRAEGLPGVAMARRFLYYSMSYQVGARKLRNSVYALDYPKDHGDWLHLVAGRRLEASHFELIADRSTGFALGETLRLGHDDYRIVGITEGEVDMAGDGMMFVSLADAETILADAPSEAVLLARAAEDSGSPGRPRAGLVMAVMLTLGPGASLAAIRDRVAQWGDVSMISQPEQVTLVVDGRLRRLRLQILLFVALMYAISGIIMALTIFTIVLEKLNAIALLKLVGASDVYIALWIIHYGLLLGFVAFATATVISVAGFRYSPRAILITPQDVGAAGAALAVVCVLACTFAIRRALRVEAREILS